ncbi:MULTISPECIES: hypothetical protein [Streptomyces]
MSTMRSSVIPYITAREGEEADSLPALRASFDAAGVSRLSYWDETAQDRDVRGVLWARVTQSLGADRLPTGAPRWRLIHPARQRECMLNFRCQVCLGDARSPEGLLFLESKKDGVPVSTLSATVRTAQPPVCRQHARTATERCPHLAAHGHVALLTQSAPLFGVIGTRHAYSENGIKCPCRR